MIKMTALQTLALGCSAIPLGYFFKNKWSFLDRYNFPTPVIGGLFYAVLILVLKLMGVLEVSFDQTFSTPLMIVFFSSLGYEASFVSLKEGGRWVFRFLALAVVVLLLQTALGLLTAQALGTHPLIGVLASAVAMVGGPGTTLAFAPSFEAAGAPDASTIGLAVAMGGIVLGGVLGTPLCTYLLNHSNVHPHFSRNGSGLLARKKETVPQGFAGEYANPALQLFDGELLKHLVVVGLILGLGTTLSEWIQNQGIKLPVYIGCMAIAAGFRNFEDKKKSFKLRSEVMDKLGGISLTLFIGIATTTLDLSQLKGSFAQIGAFLLTQTLLVALVSIFVVPRVMGKDYEAIVMSGGFLGFMLGTSANALATMTAVTEKFGPAPRAFFVVPIVGACFIDFINAGLITWMLNLFGQ